VRKFVPGDILQGVIMENICTNYAETLHSQGVNPYSQYVRAGNASADWIVQTLTKEASQEILTPLLSPEFTSFYLKRWGKTVYITEKTESEVPDLVGQFYFDQSDRVFRLNFITPTSFKRDGEYVFHPDLRLIYGSLMRKHTALHEGDEIDEDILDTLTKNTKIVRYDLKSNYSEIGRVRIPAFTGMIVIKVGGAQALVNYLNFLLHYGEYCGVGIKCAMGMGAIRINERER